MKAILLRRTGDPPVLDYVDVATPRPDAGGVLVRPTRSVSACRKCWCVRLIADRRDSRQRTCHPRNGGTPSIQYPRNDTSAGTTDHPTWRKEPSPSRKPRKRKRADPGAPTPLANKPTTEEELTYIAARDRWFESGFLQRGVRCELDPTASATCLLRATRPHRR